MSRAVRRPSMPARALRAGAARVGLALSLSVACVATQAQEEPDATLTAPEAVEAAREPVAEAVPAVDAPVPVAELEEIVVTGSRIKGAGETGLVPVLIMGKDSLDSFGAESAGELLSNLAQAGALEFNESSEGPNDARGDVAAVNLRGLGSGNTLVLLNDRRLVQHPFTQDVDQTPRSVVNLNAIPSQAIRQLEVLKDGASSLYGADATAGVVNNKVREDFEGARLTSRYSNSQGTGYQSAGINLSLGRHFNDGASHLGMFASLYDRSGIHANERDYSESADKRSLLPESWAGDTNFDNRSTISPWGVFQVGAQESEGVFRGIDAGDATGNTGFFHTQPGADGGEAALSAMPSVYANRVSGLLLPVRDLRYDINTLRQLSPDVTRANLFATYTHDFDNGISAFGELLLYRSSSQGERAPQPIDIGLAALVVPANNHYNPFGPSTRVVTNDDGTTMRVTNDRRLAGLPDGSEDGYDVLIGRWRPIGVGARSIDTDSSSYRILGGLQGTYGDWDWEAAAFWNYAVATDRTDNLISKTRLLEQLSLGTPDAINPFWGAGANTAAQYDRVRASVENEANSALASADLRINRSDWFQLPWSQHGAGVAAGLEWRNEQYEDDRDPQLDGSVVFGEGVGGDRSDIAGISPTSDSDGGRNVHSVYGELLMPIISDWRYAERIDFQAAARVERFSDTGDTVFKPKFALAWRPSHFALLRGSYSEGFRAPNLVQLYRGDISRLNNGYTDFWRGQADLPDADSGQYRRSVRESNPDLAPEDTETFTIGLRFDLPLPLNDEAQLRFSVDLWRFDQENVIDNFGAEEQLAVDYLMRSQGGLNPLVVRAAPNGDDILAFVRAGFAPEAAAGPVLYIRDPYINLDPRTVRGLDYALNVDVPTERWGRFRFQMDVSRLLEFNQERAALTPLLQDPFIRTEADFQALLEDRIGLDGTPKWRSAGNLTWRRDRWGASLSYNYIGSFFDTDATHNDTGEFWKIAPWLTVNAAVDWRFSGIGVFDNFRLRVGATNLFDEEPPLADSSRGYFTSFHNNRGRLLYLSLRTDL